VYNLDLVDREPEMTRGKEDQEEDPELVLVAKL
jgi:hypothetical protein